MFFANKYQAGGRCSIRRSAELRIRNEVGKLMMVQRKSPGKIVFDIFNTLFMIFLMAVCLLPVLHVIFASFSDAHWVMNQTGLIWRIKGLNIEGYKRLSEYVSLCNSQYRSGSVPDGDHGLCRIKKRRAVF